MIIQTSQELWMPSRSLSECRSLTLNVMIWVFNLSAIVNCVTKSLYCPQCLSLCLCATKLQKKTSFGNFWRLWVLLTLLSVCLCLLALSGFYHIKTLVSLSIRWSRRSLLCFLFPQYLISSSAGCFKPGLWALTCLHVPRRGNFLLCCF